MTLAIDEKYYYNNTIWKKFNGEAIVKFIGLERNVGFSDNKYTAYKFQIIKSKSKQYNTKDIIYLRRHEAKHCIQEFANQIIEYVDEI